MPRKGGNQIILKSKVKKENFIIIIARPQLHERDETSILVSRDYIVSM